MSNLTMKRYNCQNPHILFSTFFLPMNPMTNSFLQEILEKIFRFFSNLVSFTQSGKIWAFNTLFCQRTMKTPLLTLFFDSQFFRRKNVRMLVLFGMHVKSLLVQNLWNRNLPFCSWLDQRRYKYTFFG